MTRRRRYSFREYLTPRVLVMAALGFSSGLPFLLVGNTFGYWLRDEGSTLKAIGFLSWVGIAYSLQFAWAPLLDRVPVLKILGQRRGWMVLSQLLIAIGLFAMALVGARHGLGILGACALLVAFSSATQDIAISAWRIEIAADADELGLLTSAYQLGYRVAMLCTDSLILISAQHLGWPLSYTLCGIGMAVGLIASIIADERRFLIIVAVIALAVWFYRESHKDAAPAPSAGGEASPGPGCLMAAESANSSLAEA
ncbi:MAG: hypothetical protein ACXWLT_01525, partial [Rhizomicrobium sp.]